MKISFFTTFKLLLFLVVACVTYSSYALQISEVMYVPSDGNEWVELYNNESFNISLLTWFLQDGTSTDTLECCHGNCSLKVEPGAFALIVDKDSTLPLLNNSVASLSIFCVDDNSIGNGLSDTSDRIIIGNGSGVNTSVFDSMSYGNDVVSSRNYTLERTLDGDFVQGYDPGGTPLLPNSVWDLTREYRGLIISEVLADPVGVDTLHHPDGEWVEIYNGASHEIDLRDLTLVDNAAGELPITSANTFGSGVIICSGCYSVIYRDGNSHFSLNNNGDTVTLLIGDQIIDTMSFDDTTSGLSWSRVESSDSSSEVVFEEMTPTPLFPNVASNLCEYDLSLATDSFVENGSAYSFIVAVDLLSGVASEVNVSGTLYSDAGEIIEEYEPLSSEVISDHFEQEYSPNLDPGTYELNFSISSKCEDEFFSNNYVTRVVVVNGEDDVGDDVGGFEFWDIVDITPFEVLAGGVVSTRVVGEVAQFSRFYMWAEDGVGKLTKESEFAIEAGPFDVTLPFDLSDVCSRGGSTFIVLEGRGVTLRTEFSVVESDCVSSGSSSSSSTHRSHSTGLSSASAARVKVAEGLIVPPSIISGEAFNSTVTFSAVRGEYNVWGYVYRGSACYSCSSKTFKPEEKQFIVHSDGTSPLIVTVPIFPDTLEEGEYQVKVKVLRSGLKTPHEFRSPILVTEYLTDKKGSALATRAGTGVDDTIGSEEVSNFSRALTSGSSFSRVFGSSQGVTIYEGSNSSSTQVIGIFLALTFAVLCVILVLRKPSM